MKYRNPRDYERLCDAFSFRISAKQREFLEKMAEERNCGLCEAARSVLDDAMAHAGAEGC
jgi:hypothetical protein